MAKDNLGWRSKLVKINISVSLSPIELRDSLPVKLQLLFDDLVKNLTETCSMDKLESEAVVASMFLDYLKSKVKVDFHPC